METDNMTHFTQPSWTRPGWLEQVSGWIHAGLAQEGITVTGSIAPVHEQTVLRVPTNNGDFYFKACTPVLSHEAAVTQALYRWRPDCIPAVLQIDARQGWLLMADGGETLRSAFRRKGTILTKESWQEILALYAALQIDLAGHVEELLQFGSPDRRLHLLPDLYRNLLAEREYLLIDQPDGLTTAEYERLLEATPRVAALCAELAAYHIPMSLHHNDLHDANIFYAAGRPLFFDWGDSSIAHPFFSLRTTFVIIEYSFGLEEGDPFFDELAQAYLQPWAVVETAGNLVAAFKLAQRLWALSSAVKYKTLLRQQVELRDEYADAVPGLLQEFLAANPKF